MTIRFGRRIAPSCQGENRSRSRSRESGIASLSCAMTAEWRAAFQQVALSLGHQVESHLTPRHYCGALPDDAEPARYAWKVLEALQMHVVKPYPAPAGDVGDAVLTPEVF